MEFLTAQRLKSDNIRSLTFGVLMFGHLEFLSAQRLKSDNIRSLTFGVLMFGPGLK